MKYLWLALATSAMVGGCSNVAPSNDEVQLDEIMTLNTNTAAPVAKKIPHPLTAHGVTRVDNYYWMRDDAREDPEILSHLEKENAYLETVLAPLSESRERLYEELVSRIQKDDSTVPVLDNGYWYYTQYSGDNEYPIFIRKPTLESEDEVLLDVNKLADGHDYFSVGSVAVSSNNQLMAYSEDTVSRRMYTIKVRNIATGELYEDRLIDTSGAVVWANDNEHLFYVKKDPQTLLGFQVYRHKLGTEQAQDALMYQEDDETFYTHISKSKDDEVIYIHHDNTDMTGVTLIDANAPAQAPKTFLPIEEGHEYSVEKAGDEYFILTNKDAKNFKVMVAPANATDDMSKWKDVVAHNPDVFIQDIEIIGDYLVVKEKEQGVPRIVAHNLITKDARTIPLDDPIYGAYFTGNTQLDTDTLRIYYSSMTTPPSILDINLKTMDTKVMKQNKISDSFDASAYRSERVMVKAQDGSDIPVSLVYRKDSFSQDGTNPLYQYAYGSYGSTVEPTFRSSWISLLDRGFVVAIAHIRGGQMLGRDWYEDGKMHSKMNTFTDFIDVTKGLIEQNYVDSEKAFAMGGSAGGLLMGAVVNIAPELYEGVSAHVPFVDVVTTMSDASIPLTTGEYTEWGNPANKDEFDYMLTYSPYDQVQAQAYPNLLVTTGLHDSQVQYFEPMKWVAKLREMKTDDNLLLFKTEMEAGHGGASGRFKRLESTALEYAFVLYLAGIED
ncbi:prolyl oligopeptidase family serine peptidase [Alteromonas sp. 345S023]|uniref:Prolyl oligopeptidase family serine peptidase n=1 Tax=Alteromonas profundi TaxID=2696062 RepID=A0A7X5LM71_9ALTE|nr:S9 family peptidase [Alteromonas profundi]NDV91942.1 prolyl oligopeptidase family serine peptidase [Alteromonas profundi]